MKKSFIFIRKKIFLNLVKLGCYLNIPFLSAFGIYLSLYKSKKIQFEKNSKKTAIVFYKSGGIQDLESAFVNSKSKNRIFYFSTDECNFTPLNSIIREELNTKLTKVTKITHQ